MILKDAVQPEAWFNALPRKEYENYKHIMTFNCWYEVYDLGTETYAIYEPGHFQEVLHHLRGDSTWIPYLKDLMRMNAV